MLKIYAISVLSILAATSYATLHERAGDGAPPPPATREPAPADRIFASGIVEGRTQDVELRPEAFGRVVEVLVREGDWVEADQPLVRLDDRAERAQLEASLAKRELARANLDRIVNGARESERQEARAALVAAQARLRQARLAWQRIQALRAQAAVTQQEADDHDGIVATLAAEVDAAKARLDQLEAAAREDEVRAAQARVAIAEADVDRARVALDRCTLRASLDARVLEVRIEPGETVSPTAAEPVLVLADTSQLRVRAFVEEIDAPRIAVGATALVTADGLPGRTFAAVVCTVSPQMTAKRVATDRPDELYDSKVREVLLDVDPSSGEAGLIVGLRVDVLFGGNDKNLQRGAAGRPGSALP